jgi:hypothetical protein
LLSNESIQTWVFEDNAENRWALGSPAKSGDDGKSLLFSHQILEQVPFLFWKKAKYNMSPAFSHCSRCENVHDDRLPRLFQICRFCGGGGGVSRHRAGAVEDYTEADDRQVHQFGVS